ncbi:hypothetical protein [Streptomyces sp. LN785]|uniref:hypothetical protein n=1 Tax=Streptomyces sp. LN785 TaxID=3112983 RepID=UPI00371CE953
MHNVLTVRAGAAEHLWLLVRPTPGHSFDLPRYFGDGHQTYLLVELRRLRDGGEVAAAARCFAAPRHREAA